MQLTISIEYSRLYDTSRLKSLIFRTKKLLSKTVTAISPKQHMCVNQQATSFALHGCNNITFLMYFLENTDVGVCCRPIYEKSLHQQPSYFFISKLWQYELRDRQPLYCMVMVIFDSLHSTQLMYYLQRH